AKIDLTGLNFQEAVFDGADLRGMQAKSADFRKASFKNAKLDKAGLEGCKLTGANFEGASLVKADLQFTRTWKGVTAQGADLSGAFITYANLSGADLSGAELKGAKFHQTTFDETTRFPSGFEVPKELLWKGKGVDPREEPVVAESLGGGQKITREEAMERLSGLVVPAKLSKAKAMLRAERFSLYSQAEKDYLVGVVKSQTS